MLLCSHGHGKKVGKHLLTTENGTVADKILVLLLLT